ncbi:MAG: hypothetical protein IJR45_00295, partial [Firmicutes bacterium]|nr:hypothetical protein [Bacillota bacterium]
VRQVVTAHTSACFLLQLRPVKVFKNTPYYAVTLSPVFLNRTLLRGKTLSATSRIIALNVTTRLLYTNKTLISSTFFRFGLKIFYEIYKNLLEISDNLHKSRLG